MMDFIAIGNRVLEAARGKEFTSVTGVTGTVSEVEVRFRGGPYSALEITGWGHHGADTLLVSLGAAYLYDAEPPEIAVDRALAYCAAAPANRAALSVLAATLGMIPANDAAPSAPAAEVA